MRRLDSNSFRKKIFLWYRIHGRHSLPWRRTRDPYRIFVSEVMLQQTQMARVLPKYKAWLKVFPNWSSLARAPFTKVLKLWHGLGYNRRARFMKSTAEELMVKYKGQLPETLRELELLPGIGPYTARAIRCFAYGACEPFIETNIRRVVIHSFFPSRQSRISDKDILRILKEVEPRTQKREWYWALMDYGAVLPSHNKSNPNVRSRAYKKQSRFEGSTRYVRAVIVKALIEKKKLTLSEVKKVVRGNPYTIPFIKNGALDTILQGLEKDRILMYNNRYWAVRHE